MELRRISRQQKTTLLEFYNPKEWPSQWKRMPEMMCELIKSLELIKHEPVWVFTSHAELLFTSKDDYQDWQVLVKIIEMDKKQFYKITVAHNDPWHHLTGFSDNPNKASELVISGLSVAVIGKNRNIFLDSN
ncbi:hypothetical protein [Winogradskyella vidalii]|uniref:hypothetical protein n=1 Tax=Winogradskyella vidalii TaxID=2615024 RepID=UPI0015CE903A|nr:hypothetical protein [Winogradskyella vidalii]